MRRKIILAVLILLTFILQGTIFQTLSIASIAPNLLLILTVSFGFMRGKREGLIIGFFSGLLVDIFYGNVVVIDRVSDDPYMASAGIYDVHRIANEEKLVPREWMNKEANYVTKDFIDYVKPLIQGDYQPIMVNGLPRHLVLDLNKKR